MKGGLSMLAPLLAVAAVAASDTVLLPPADAVIGFEPLRQARVFTGSGLYGHIDGGAEIFFEFGFEEAMVQRYLWRGETVEVELYRMTDPTAALGIYLQRCGNRCDAAGLHPEMPRYTTWGQLQLIFVRDRFLAVITAERASDHTEAALATLAIAVENRLPPDPPRDPAAALPPGWSAGSVRLIRGPLALQAIVTLGDGDVLQLRGTLTAIAADYPPAPGQPACTLVLVDYPDEGAARSAFAHLRGNLDSEIKVLAGSKKDFVFRDYAGKFGSVVATDRRLTLRLNLQSEPTPRSQ